MNAENADETDGGGLKGFRHLEITRQIVGVFFEVYGELGYGFLESVYRSAMSIALREKGLAVQSEVELVARFRGSPVGTFRADLVVENVVVVELKAARGIDQAHIAQGLNYLRCTSLETGLVLNFGPRPQIRRLVFANERKRSLDHDTT
ncbi:MAG TPA: GxxExxY protein [Gemmatimonadales bacterium]|nr:GxxExxY protein [Gemmatimonadales bacterium]